MSTRALAVAQIKHALENGEKLIAAKKGQIEALRIFQQKAPAAVRRLVSFLAGEGSLDLQDATETLFKSLAARAEVELEELQLQVKGIEYQYKQATSMISVPGQN